MSSALAILDYVLAAVGLVTLFAFLAAQRRGLWGLPNLREHRTLRVEHLAIPMFAFLTVHALGSEWAARSATNDETAVQAHLLTNIAGTAAGGVACAVVGALLFAGGLRGFVSGGRPWSRTLLWAVGGWLVTLPLCWATERLSTELLKVWRPGFEPPPHEVLELLDRGGLPAWFPVLLWVSAVVVAPVAEELFFRGLLQTAVVRFIKPPAAAITVVAVMFGLAHAAQPHAILPLAVLGFVLGYVYERSGSLAAPVVLHALFNFKSMLYFWLLQGTSAT